MKEAKPLAVRYDANGQIRIKSSRSLNWYTTDQHAGCNCIAGERGKLCWHIRWRAQHLSDHVEALTKLGRTRADITRILCRDFPEIAEGDDEHDGS